MTSFFDIYILRENSRSIGFSGDTLSGESFDMHIKKSIICAQYVYKWNIWKIE